MNRHLSLVIFVIASVLASFHVHSTEVGDNVNGNQKKAIAPFDRNTGLPPDFGGARFGNCVWETMPGDPNCDGINVGDVLQALKHSSRQFNLDSLSDDEQHETLVYDVAPTKHIELVDLALGDGHVDEEDIMVILRASIGLAKLVWPTRKVSLVDTCEMRGQSVQISFPASGVHLSNLRLDGPIPDPDIEYLSENQDGRLIHVMAYGTDKTWSYPITYSYKGPFLGHISITSAYHFCGSILQSYEDIYDGNVQRAGVLEPVAS